MDMKTLPLDFRTIFKNITHALIILDLNNNIIFANNFFFKLLKISNSKQARILNKNITNFLSDDFRLFFDSVCLSLKKKQSWLGRIDLIDQEKNTLKTFWEIIPIDHPKDIKNYYVCWISIFKRNKPIFYSSFLEKYKKNRLELLLLKKLLTTTKDEVAFFIQSVPTPISILDKKLRYVVVNDCWRKEYASNKICVTGKKWNEIFNVGNAKWNKICRRCLNGETISAEKDLFINSNGKQEWIKWKAFPRKNENAEIDGIIIISEVITDKIAHEEKINHIMHYDALTNTPNRYYFHEKMREILKENNHNKFTVLIFAISNLDEVNNYYNVFIGDLFLQEITKKIKENVTKDTFVARFDGGQFALILPFSDGIKINHLVNKFNLSFVKPLSIQNYKILANYHIGLRRFKSGDKLNYEDIIKDAEIALSYAKTELTNKVAYFDTTLQKNYVRTLLLENDLQQSFDSSQFYIVYQPYFSLHAMKIVGIEALVRWSHPKLNEVFPTEFIPLADKTGKIIELGYWILNKVFSDIQNLLKRIKKLPNFNFSINLSPNQLSEQNFMDNLKQMILKYKIPPKILQFEITENQLLQHLDNIITMLEKINNLGCKIAIDDFGTGHSSLERLKELPISVIKIDKGFVDNIDTNEKSTLLVKHILMLANEWGLNTIAEGIEKPEQAHMLKFLGCNIGQGFYYSKPISLDNLIKKFLSHNGNGNHINSRNNYSK